MTATDHLRTWFTPARRKLISTRAVDVMAGRPVGTLTRFLAREKYMTFERIDIAIYYPTLALLGYVPPTESEVEAG